MGLLTLDAAMEIGLSSVDFLPRGPRGNGVVNPATTLTYNAGTLLATGTAASLMDLATLPFAISSAL
jgi:hypothetical protein